MFWSGHDVVQMNIVPTNLFGFGFTVCYNLYHQPYSLMLSCTASNSCWSNARSWGENGDEDYGCKHTFLLHPTRVKGLLLCYNIFNKASFEHLKRRNTQTKNYVGETKYLCAPNLISTP